MDITDKKRLQYKERVIDAITQALSNNYDRIVDLSDIGNEIGYAVSSITCTDGNDLNIWSFEYDDLVDGINHGYSVNNGTH